MNSEEVAPSSTVADLDGLRRRISNDLSTDRDRIETMNDERKRDDAEEGTDAEESRHEDPTKVTESSIERHKMERVVKFAKLADWLEPYLLKIVLAFFVISVIYHLSRRLYVQKEPMKNFYNSKRLNPWKEPHEGRGDALMKRNLELDFDLNRDPLQIYLIWTTAPETFTERNFKVLDAYLFHHPDATITIFASQLPMDHFDQYAAAGYKVSVSRLDDAALAELAHGCPGSSWVRDPRWKKGPYYYSHLTDYIRFCVLFKHGGVYSDFDALTLRRIDDLGDTFIGKDSAGSGGTCRWCIDDGDTYLAPGVMATSPGHDLVRTALGLGFTGGYDPNVFNVAGPKAVTLAYKDVRKRGGHWVNVLDKDVFYPYNYLTSWKAFEKGPDGTALAESLSRKSASLHLYGHKTKHLTVEEGSIVESVMSERSVILQSVDMNDVKHSLRGPKLLGVGKYIEEVKHLRVIAVPKATNIGILITAAHGRLRISRKGLTKHEIENSWSSRIILKPDSPAALNQQLSRLLYFAKDIPNGRDNITVQTFADDVNYAEIDNQLIIPVYEINELVTIMVKTFGRIDKVMRLVESSLKIFPNITIIATDDGYNYGHNEPEGFKRAFYYFPSKYDIGLSAGRNRMVERVQTEFIVTLDDDFLLTEDSRIENLIHALDTSDNEGKKFDIAAAKNPEDEKKFELDFCGVMTITPSRVLSLGPGSLGTHANCHHVEFVPNIFMARTELLRNRLRWDELLKLGEHEDFFLRAKEMGVRTLTCPGISFKHNQVEHWKMQTDYDRMRNRVYDFWRLSLRKHKLTKLVSFGRTMMDLVVPKPIEALNATEVLSTSVTLYWRSSALSFKVLKSSDRGNSWAPVNHGEGENFTPIPIVAASDPEGQKRPEGSFNRMLVYGLSPDTAYLFRVHAGNRFDYEEAGNEIRVRTTDALADHQIEGVNLISNPSFERNTADYIVSRENRFQVTEPGMNSPHAGHSEITTEGYLYDKRTVAAVWQDIDIVALGDAVKKSSHGAGVTMTFVGSSRLGEFYDQYPSWRMEVRVWYANMFAGKGNVSPRWAGGVPSLVRKPDEMHVVEFDRSNGEWHTRIITVCVSADAVIVAASIAGAIETFRGHVKWDDFGLFVGRGAEYGWEA